ncbi:aspartate kinase [Gallaecimonas xiamenensis]|uniref:Aspartokinase n=1 Tax=Gallaecimonas xiamenensis 3-C-1 TaxID=745411 RepID=K2K2J2_9GAMM|nr:aspartate kinase [Gallaecimonas xiamenensis]EKE71680.1 aspartate kinase [Gallaecimonas xiamenensis 3-C-1]
MALIVQKFGGTSVGTLARIEAVAERIIATRKQGHDLVVVVSAMAGETNRLITMAQALCADPDPRELDVLLATGEQTTIALLAMALKARGQPALSLTGDQVRVQTDHRHGKARILKVDTAVMDQALARGQVVIVAGFQGRGPDNAITTLGRGGSDTTAVALAAALKASECQIFTDVDGIYTTDPRIEPQARRLDSIDFDSMLALAAQGAKVLQVRSVEFAGQFQVPLRVLSSFSEGQGTLITYGDSADEGVCGVACCGQSALIEVSGEGLDQAAPGRLLSPLQDAGIDADLLDTVFETGKPLTFTVPLADLGQALPMVQASAIALGGAKVQCDNTVAKVSVIGGGFEADTKMASLISRVLGEQGIEQRLFRTTPKRYSLLVDRAQMEESVRHLHRALIPQKSSS